MRKEKLIKVTGLNLGIALADTVILSPSLLGHIIGAGIFATAFDATAVFMSAAVFIYGNYKLLIRKDKVINTSEIKTIEDITDALKQNDDKKCFKEDVETIYAQIGRFYKKKNSINDILLQKFSSTEMSYSKFNGTVQDVEDVFYINLKSILNKLNAFDEKEYEKFSKENIGKKFSPDFIQAKLSIYNEYINFVRNAVEDNEEILLKLDKLLLEISKFNSLEDGEIDNMPAMREIDDLINKTKLYK